MCMTSGKCNAGRCKDRYVLLDQLGRHKRLLLLQGPNGPFFARLARRLARAGCEIRKVNFNGGDALFFPGSRAISFRKPMDEWREFLIALLNAEAPEAIVLFGQWRPQHRIAIDVAKGRGLRFYVFEEGYIRPWWITLEAGEVNAGSHLRELDLAAIPDQPTPRQPVRFRFAFAKMACWSFLYFLFGMVLRSRFPHYEHHRPFELREAGCWLRSLFRKCRYVLTERDLRRQLLDPSGAGFFLVPLQLSTDSQLLYASPWRSNVAFISHVIRSFSRHANDTDLLVFKHHPMERGHADYAADIDRLARQYGISSRVRYLRDARIPALLKRAKGVVLINSTVGLQALFHRVPLCTCGDAFYNKDALVPSQSVDAFWKRPIAASDVVFRKFYRYMLRETQINASFYVESIETE